MRGLLLTTRKCPVLVSETDARDMETSESDGDAIQPRDRRETESGACTHCGTTLEPGAWALLSTYRDDDGLQLARFCDETCQRAWEHEMAGKS